MTKELTKSFAKNKIPKIEKMHLKINKISEKVHMFNPLSTKKKKCNNLYINKLTKIKFKTKNYFITGTNWHNSKTMYQIIFHVVSNGNKKGYIVFELCQLQ